MKDRIFFAIGIGAFTTFLIILITNLFFWVMTAEFIPILDELTKRVMITSMIIFTILGFIGFDEGE